MWNGTILSSIHFRCRYGGFRNGSYNLFIVTFYIISYYLQKIILFIKSDLHLVTDLQNCVKAQQNAAYARKVKLSNLKEMAKTVAYVQEHGYDSLDALETSFSSVKEHTDTFRKNLKSTERDLREINEQLHYTGQYLANKAIYTKFCQSKNKGVFRKEHSAEIALYETARKFLKEKSGNIKLPYFYSDKI